ncbi:hypothetical protein ABIA85_005906 [Bradyrhizobium sp. LA6.10]|uniref:hypothetical protein n=1 Tax=Bradyrhizobium sp. LA6.10 TaxID=3156318 RepID=UPI00339B7615
MQLRDPGDDDDADPLGWNRTYNLVSIIEEVRAGKKPKALLSELEDLEDANDFCKRCEAFGIFSNSDTLEVDLFSGDFIKPIIKTLREGNFGKKRTSWIDAWAKDAKSLDRDDYLTLIDAIGKGRFAQRLVANLDALKPPRYIKAAIEYVVKNV